MDVGPVQAELHPAGLSGITGETSRDDEINRTKHMIFVME
jgi:hypothetical protein